MFTGLFILVMEQAHAGKGHDHSLLVALLNDQIITDRAAGLCDVLNTGGKCTLNVITEGEECVTAQVAMDALRDEKEKQLGNQQIYGECWHNPENYVFTDMLGKHLVRRTVVKHFRAVSDRAGIKNVRFHDLRHSFAVNSLMIGDDVKTVQTNLGHAAASFTLDAYGHITQKMKNDSAERMQQFFNAIRVT